MNLQEFRELVKAEFGDDLRHATPANVRDFAIRLDTQFSGFNPGERIDITAPPLRSYEEAIKDFFARILELPCDVALMRLYAVALDLAFAGIESDYAERMSSFFRDLEEQ